MTRYIKDDSGKFAGSIGDGATNIPTAAPEVAHGSQPFGAEANPAQAIDQAYSAFSRRQANPFVPDFVDPETTDAVLKKLDKVAERITRKLDGITDDRFDLRTGKSFWNPYDKAQVLERYRAEEERLRDAAMEAREYLENAKAIMEDREPKIVAYQSSASLEADDVSYVASELGDIFGEEELQDDWDRGDAVVMDKVRRASNQILKAKRVLKAAIVPAKRDPEPEEEFDEDE